MFQEDQSTKNHINYSSINKETFCISKITAWLVEDVLWKLRSTIKSYWNIISLVLNCNLMRDEMSLMAQKTSFLLMFVSPTQNLGCLFFLDVTYLLWFICFVCMKVSSIIGHKGCSIHLPHDTIFIIPFRVYCYCQKA